MSKDSYQEILTGDYKVLGYYLDKCLVATASDGEIIDLIAVRIMPLIRKFPIFRKFYLQYILGKDEYYKVNIKFERHISFWVAWEQLYIIEWCWITPLSFFNDNHEKYCLSDEMIQLLSLHSDWCEINAIKKGQKYFSHKSFFSKTQILKYLEIIVDEIIMEQALAGAHNQHDELIKNEQLIFYSIQLTLPDIRLYLDIKWSQNGNTIRYFLSKFQNGSSRHLFMLNLLEKRVAAIDLHEDKKGSASKNLSYAKLNNDLGHALIETVNSLTLSMKKTCFMQSDFSEKHAKEISLFIHKQIAEGEFKEVPCR